MRFESLLPTGPLDVDGAGSSGAAGPGSRPSMPMATVGAEAGPSTGGVPTLEHATDPILESLGSGDAGRAGHRHLKLTPASAIRPRPVFWLWEQRLAQGTLGLLAGREGLGKSTVAYWLAARVTRGELPGEHYGIPKGVLIAATEDSWEHTIVPRLMASDADLDRVFRVEAVTSDDVIVGLVLPRDLADVESAVNEVDAALILLDPLMSRLDGELDTHKDGEVRRALEPLVKVADDSGAAVLGIMHFNKSGSTDPLTLVMGSKAFAAVARSVHTVVADPDDEEEQRRLFGTPKNNLGRTDLSTLSFQIVPHLIATDEGPAHTGRVDWIGETSRTIGDALREGDREQRSATAEAGHWLEDYLSIKGGQAESADIKRDGGKSGHSEAALKRARRKRGLQVVHEGFPRRTLWGTPVGEPPSK